MANLRLMSRKPTSPVEILADRMKQYLHLPDPAPVYALMGALAANILEGPPVWLMYVGPPGCGKTELLNALCGIERIHPVDSIDGPAAFLSGSGKRDTAREATGGLLHQVGLHGGLVIKDFTGVLSLDPSSRKLVLDCLRQSYDGSWSRPVGSDGGKPLRWPREAGQHGHVALFAGVTGEIDQHSAVNSSLGERWLYYRFDARSNRAGQFTRARQAVTNSGQKDWKSRLRDMVTAFALSQCLGFGEGRIARRDPTDTEMLRLEKMAGVAAMCRSAVPRDSYRHEVSGVPETENNTRISTQFAQLYAGMEYVGVSTHDRWRIMSRIALDSMPLMRRIILTETAKAGDTGTTYGALRQHIGASDGVIKRSVDDLRLHGALTLSGDEESSTVRVKLSEFVRHEWEGEDWFA